MTPSQIRIEPCTNPRRFVDLQRRFYVGDPHYVPPLTLFDKDKLDRRRNPFFDHAEVGLFVAYRDREPVGRITTTRDREHDRFHGDRVGFFGHFEAKDGEAAEALLHHAEHWLRERGAESMRGPVDLSSNYRIGLLIEGEPGPPFLMMPHNPPHYRGYLEAFGLEKAKDLLAVIMATSRTDKPRMDRITNRIRQRIGITTRRFDPKRFDEEVSLLWGLYNEIWAKNWGFAPMTEAEFKSEARGFKPVLRKELTVIAEIDGRPIAFVIGVSDVNVGIKACNGRLFPFGWWKFMRAMRSVRSFRTLTLGVHPDWQKTGVDAVILSEIFRGGASIDFNDCEASWILEDNIGMLKPLQANGGIVHRRYRVYEKPLT